MTPDDCHDLGGAHDERLRESEVVALYQLLRADNRTFARGLQLSKLLPIGKEGSLDSLDAQPQLGCGCRERLFTRALRAEVEEHTTDANGRNGRVDDGLPST